MDSTVQDLTNIRPEVKVTNELDWSDFDVIVFGNLNPNPKVEDQKYAQAMKNLFESHLKMKLKESSKVLFGQNMR